jgi:hypothetical protein
MRTEGQTDRHDESITRFTQFLRTRLMTLNKSFEIVARFKYVGRARNESKIARARKLLAE